MKEKKTAEKKGFFSKKRIVAVVILIALVAVMIFSNPEVQKFLLDPEDVKISFQAGTSYEPVVYGKEMLLVSNDGIRAIDKNGREAWSIVAPVTSPMVIVKDKNIMVADINGTAVNVYNREKIISQIKTEREILSAKMNKNGYVAVATDERGYKGAVMVYDKMGKQFFKWYSGSGYIGDVDISQDKQLAVAQLMTDKEQLYTRIMVTDTDSDKEAKCIAEIDGAVMKLRYKDNGEILAVSDKGAFCFKKSGKQDFKIDFGSRTLVACNIDNQRNMVFAFDSGLNNTILESYSLSGKLRGSYETDGEMLAFDVNGEYILSASLNGITRTSPSGREKSKLDINRDVKKIKVFSGRDELLLIGSGSAEIVKIR